MRKLGSCSVGLALTAALTVAGCGGGTSRKSTTSASTAATTTPATTAPAASAPTTSVPPTSAATAATSSPGSTVWAYPVPPSVVAGTTGSSGSTGGTTTSASGSTASGGTPGTATPGATSTVPTPTPPSGSTAAAGTVLKGTIPADPTTAFTGTLFLVGQRFALGSSVQISYQGTPVALLPASFTSSELLGVSLAFGAPGDYTFTVLDTLGASSSPLLVSVGSAGSATNAFTSPPAIQMVFPTSVDTSFAGTVWIMGDHFLPGATLLVSTAGGVPVVAPLLWMNERTLGWVTATPFAGTLTLQVVNPTFTTSNKVGLVVKGGAAAGAGQPAPSLLLPPTSVTSPFVGTTRVFGKSFQAGAVLELTDSTGAVTKSPLLFISSDEAWWVLAYPSAGSYTALVRNPDGQATPTWKFTVN